MVKDSEIPPAPKRRKEDRSASQHTTGSEHGGAGADEPSSLRPTHSEIRQRLRFIGRMDRFWCWLAFRLPCPLVYWTLIRAGAYASTGPYKHTDPTAMRYMLTLERWARKAS